MSIDKYILAFDTANEFVSIGIGQFYIDNQSNSRIKLVASKKIFARRASNTTLLPEIDELIKAHKLKTKQISSVATGIGPGSFTGVRIALATAKGICAAHEIPLVGLNTLDAVAEESWLKGYRGHLYVVADAMRKEIYPALYNIGQKGITRLSENKVLKAQVAADEALDIVNKVDNLRISGDALKKYLDLFEWGNIENQENWTPSGMALLKLFEQKMESRDFWNLNYKKYNPAYVLPVYTRLSDAEENERLRLADNSSKNLKSGVQASAKDNESSIEFLPMSKKNVNDVADLEKKLMPKDAWNALQLEKDLMESNRTWWVCIDKEKVIGYAGGFVADNKLDILKIAVDADYQRKKIAKKLISFVAFDARDLGAQSCILEVRKSNSNAIDFYKHLSLEEISQRKKYYKDGEDAIIMAGKLPLWDRDVAGMNLQQDQISNKSNVKHPIILAIESSCDETAASISCDGEIIADVVASQIDFHKRFGGVVPEIASRKHIEAIYGVFEECIELARQNLNNPSFCAADLDVVAATYAPGLVGALVVGFAFTKGLAWAANKPLIGVNHLEGHVFANKLSCEVIEMPAVASIISGGNTLLVHIKNWGDYETLGTTIDDAVGEAFDKVAKRIGLGYPGGPIISKLAKSGNSKAINFPRAMLHSGDYDFSLSGLKTAVVNYIQQHENEDDYSLNDLCASFQQAIIDVQVAKAKEAIKKTGAKSFLFGGGVAANPELRKAYEKMCADCNVKLIMSPLQACGDNAAMIALVADSRYKQNKFFDLKKDVQAHASLDIPY